MEMMKAAILKSIGEKLEVGTVSLPSEIECGQVLVEVYYSSLCGSQLERFKV